MRKHNTNTTHFKDLTNYKTSNFYLNENISDNSPCANPSRTFKSLWTCDGDDDNDLRF